MTNREWAECNERYTQIMTAHETKKKKIAQAWANLKARDLVEELTDFELGQLCGLGIALQLLKGGE